MPGVRPVLYDVTAALPAEAAGAEVMVVPSHHLDRVLALVRELSSLRLVQTLSAGTEQLTGRLPNQGALSSARGAHGIAVAEWTVATLLMLPLTDDTRRLAGQDFLSRMRDGAILVNAARGGVVDTEALLAETASGRLRAILDVTDPEPLPSDHPLWHTPGALITPHVAGNVPEADERAWKVAAAQIGQLARGEQPANLVI